MSRFKDWCEKVMPFVVASSNGEVVQASCDNGNSWFDMDECEMSDPALQFDFGDYDYRIKPRTIKIGDFDVPEPMRNNPMDGQSIYVVTPQVREGITSCAWLGCGWQCVALGRGLVHESAENAESHARALFSFSVKK